MQIQQDMGKAYWLSTSTLVGRLSLSTPGTTGCHKQELSVHTLILHPPQIF